MKHLEKYARLLYPQAFAICEIEMIFIAYTIYVCYYLYNIKFGQRSIEQFDCPMCIDTYLNFKVFSPMNFNLMNNKIQTKVEIKGQTVKFRLWSVYTLFEFC